MPDPLLSGEISLGEDLHQRHAGFLHDMLVALAGFERMEGAGEIAEDDRFGLGGPDTEPFLEDVFVPVVRPMEEFLAAGVTDSGLVRRDGRAIGYPAGAGKACLKEFGSGVLADIKEED